MSVAPNGLSYWCPDDRRRYAEVVVVLGRRVAVWKTPQGMRGDDCWEAEDIATCYPGTGLRGEVLCWGTYTRKDCIEAAERRIREWREEYRLGAGGQLEMVI